MLVVVLIAVLASLSIPAFRSTLSGRQVRQAASLVASALSKTRVAAIRQGKPQQFCFEPGGTEFWVQEYDPLGSGGSAGSTSTVTNKNLAGGPTTALPENIVFDDGSLSGLAPLSNGLMTVTFFPDGTSQDSTVVVMNDSGRMVPVTVRGLTGVSELGELQASTVALQ